MVIRRLRGRGASGSSLGLGRRRLCARRAGWARMRSAKTAAAFTRRARFHDDEIGREEGTGLQGAIGAEHVANLDVGEGDVGGLAARALVEGGVLVDGDGLRDFVGTLDGDGEVFDGGDFSGGPGFAEFGATLLGIGGLLRIEDHDEHSADGPGLVVEIAGGHDGVADMDVGDLRFFAVLADAGVGTGFDFVGLALVILDGDLGAGDGGDLAHGAVAAGAEHSAAAHAAAAAPTTLTRTRLLGGLWGGLILSEKGRRHGEGCEGSAEDNASETEAGHVHTQPFLTGG